MKITGLGKKILYDSAVLGIISMIAFNCNSDAKHINKLFTNAKKIEVSAPRTILDYYYTENGPFRQINGVQTAYVDSIKAWNSHIKFKGGSGIPYSAIGKSMTFPDLDNDGYVGYANNKHSN